MQATLQNISINLERVDINGTIISLAQSNTTNATTTSSARFTIHQMTPVHEGTYLCRVYTMMDNFTVDLNLSYQERLATTPMPTTNRPTMIATSKSPTTSNTPTTRATSSIPTTSVNQITQQPLFCISEVREGILWQKTLAGMTASSKCAPPAQGKIFFHVQ